MKEIRPPRLAEKLFDWYCDVAHVDDLRGDMEEWFYLNAQKKSPFRARLIYWKHVLSLLTSYAVRKRKKSARFSPYYSNTNSFAMLRNYLKVALRNLYQHRYFSLLNAFGLAIGMSISLLLISLTSYVTTYDNFHTKADRIYSIVSTRTEGTDEIDFSSAPLVLADNLKDNFPGAEEVVRIQSEFVGEVKFDRENIPLSGYYADPNFFNVFTFEMLEGNPSTVLTQPNTVVLTESAAQKLFRSTDVVGKSFEMNGTGHFTITGVMKDAPKNSHLKFEALASYATLPVSTLSVAKQWTDYRDQYIYVLLQESASVDMLDDFLSKTSVDINKLSAVRVQLETEALSAITMSERYNGIGQKWEVSGFVVFAIIAVIILLPACFNYTNISIARALKRSKEIGIRKTMGGVRNQIFFQFITETVLITLISLGGAVGIFMLVRAEFQSMLVEASYLDLSLTWATTLAFIAFAMVTGFLAGAFPAAFFARLNPIQALKTQSAGASSSGMRLRKGLTIFQFALSFCFIVSLVVFSRQYRSLLNFDFGFQRENIVDVELKNVNPEILKTEFSKIPAVQSVSLSSGTLGLFAPATWAILPESGDSVEVSQLFVDTDFIKNFNLQFLAGDNFPVAPFTQEQFLIVNEKFLESAKIANPASAIGKTFIVEGKELQIRGVLKNFNFAAPQLPITAFFFRMDPSRYTYANLNVNVSDAYGAFSAMEASWKQFAGEEKFVATFFEDKLNEAFHAYRGLLKMAGFLGLLAITISVLGLLGMVVYTSENRAKEVSIRKVMGASVAGITLLLSKDYIKLIAWAIVIAIPLMVFVFEMVFSRIPGYQTNLTVWDVLVAAVALVLLGLATILSQTRRTAMANPAETLRSE